MFLRLIPVLALLLPAIACDVSTDNDLGREGDAPAGGKADTIDDSDAVPLCPADVYVTHAANEVNNHVYSNCHDAATGKFTTKACCAEEMDLIEDISGCPSQVAFNKASGSDKRCVNDVTGDSEHGQFVALQTLSFRLLDRPRAPNCRRRARSRCCNATPRVDQRHTGQGEIGDIAGRPAADPARRRSRLRCCRW